MSSGVVDSAGEVAATTCAALRAGTPSVSARSEVPRDIGSIREPSTAATSPCSRSLHAACAATVAEYPSALNSSAFCSVNAFPPRSPLALPCLRSTASSVHAAVRLPAAVHVGLIAHRFLPPILHFAAMDGGGVSRFSCVKFPCMPEVFDSAAPASRSRFVARRSVAFRFVRHRRRSWF